jgi:phosphoglycolate phosphatase
MSRSYYTAKAKGCSVATLRNFWKAYDNFIFDADGVLWTGQKAIDGAPEVINKLIDAGKRVLILTNNSTRGLDQWVEKCHKLEFTGLS